MAKHILIANWKNHPSSLREATALLSQIQKKKLIYKKLNAFFAPPYVYYESVAQKIKSFAGLASQDIFFTAEGIHTGAITPDLLKGFGVKLCIIGHSERRELGETNEVVSQKVKTALRANITPVVCVGEKTRDHEGEHLEFLREQLKNSLEGVRRKDDAGKLIIAYEPVWATGRRARDAASPAELSQTVLFIKKALTDIFGREAADNIPILYGGAVEPANAKALIAATGIRGFLVGHAALDGKALNEIAETLTA